MNKTNNFSAKKEKKQDQQFQLSRQILHESLVQQNYKLLPSSSVTDHQ